MNIELFKKHLDDLSKLLLLCCFLTLAPKTYSQKVTKQDSIFIFKHLLFYHQENKTFDDIDEPYIEEYWSTQNENAKKYFYLSTFIRSIPISQRVILISYLDEETKIKSHNWIYLNMSNKNDTIEYYNILNSDYGIPYSKLKIEKGTLLKYCPSIKYK
jgi:hypothetical protein